MTSLLDDLQAEQTDLDALSSGADLDRPTPAEGWTVGDTIAHLWFFDREATTALVDPDAFVARAVDDGRNLGDRLPDVWRQTRADLRDALRAADPSSKVPWYGP